MFLVLLFLLFYILFSTVCDRVLLKTEESRWIQWNVIDWIVMNDLTAIKMMRIGRNLTLQIGDGLMWPTLIDIVLVSTTSRDIVLNNNLTLYRCDVTIHQETLTLFCIWFIIFNAVVPPHINGTNQEASHSWWINRLVWKLVGIWKLMNHWEELVGQLSKIHCDREYVCLGTEAIGPIGASGAVSVHFTYTLILFNFFTIFILIKTVRDIRFPSLQK